MKNTTHAYLYVFPMSISLASSRLQSHTKSVKGRHFFEMACAFLKRCVKRLMVVLLNFLIILSPCDVPGASLAALILSASMWFSLAECFLTASIRRFLQPSKNKFWYLPVTAPFFSTSLHTVQNMTCFSPSYRNHLCSFSHSFSREKTDQWQQTFTMTNKTKNDKTHTICATGVN